MSIGFVILIQFHWHRESSCWIPLSIPKL